MKKILIILIIFGIDRLTKMYLINLQSSGTEIDFYIFSFLNFYLIWNTGIGFGLAALESNIYYHILTTIIVFINIGLIYFLLKSKGIYSYLIALVIGGSLGNLFDRIYYYAVPDFIDLHLGSYHWFIFNVADIFITTGIIGLVLVELLKKEKVSKAFSKIEISSLVVVASSGFGKFSKSGGKISGSFFFTKNSSAAFLLEPVNPLFTESNVSAQDVTK